MVTRTRLCAGFSAERIETYRKLSYTVEFSKSGDTFTATVTFASDTIPAQSYSFKLGETFDYNSIDGTKPKVSRPLTTTPSMGPSPE